MEAQSPYKSKGVISMKIEKLNEFARQIGKPLLSEPVYIRGLPWKIKVVPRKVGEKQQKYQWEIGEKKQKYQCLGYFVQCNAQNDDPKWKCGARAILKLLSQKEGKEEHIRKIVHTFSAKENDWGFAQFMTFEALMDSESGWYDESTDSIIVSAEIDADIPEGIDFSSSIAEQMGNLYEKGGQFTDFTLIAPGGREFKVYKGILACRSPVFAAMFEHEELRESKQGFVQIKDINAEVLEQMLRFIYSGVAPNLENMAGELLIAANKYDLGQLKMLCERVLVDKIENANVCELLILADRHSAEYLKAQALKHIQENAKEVTKTDGWNLLIEANDVNLMNQIVKAMAAAAK